MASAFGILVGFVIVFLLGQANDGRTAIGNEATSIGTAFDEAQLFPVGEPMIQHALICYSRAVTEIEWDAMAKHESAPEVDQAYRELVAVYGDIDEPTDGAFQPAAATNSFAQIGGISTARETRLEIASNVVSPLLWGLLAGSAALVLLLLFVVTVHAKPIPQAILLGLASMFTVVLLLLVLTLSSPYGETSAPLTPELIEDNTDRMVALAPEVADEPCSFE